MFATCHRTLAVATLIWAVFTNRGPATEPVQLLPWASNRHEADESREHIESVTSKIHKYDVVQSGTMDGENCRSPVGVYEGWEQTWESNRFVRLENVGRADIINPWLSNGRNNVRSAEEIVESAIEAGMTDREKAIAIWHQETQYRFHFSTLDQEDNNPVKVFNSYGFNTCGDDSMCLAGLWRRAGLRVRPARIVGHCVSQVYYDGGWHLMDGDMHSVYLLRDNKTIASEHDLVHDHDLIKRSRTHGVLANDDRQTSEWEASLYVYEGDAEATRDLLGDHTMNMVLRPHESLTWRWGHLDPIKFHGGSDPKYPDRICNGAWEYRPDFASDTWRAGTEQARDIRSGQFGITASPERVGVVDWKMQSPYVIVGGKLEADATGAELFISWDGIDWETVHPDLDRFFPAGGPARYEYYLRCRLEKGTELRQLVIHNDLQMAPLAMPGMQIGRNEFAYSDESLGDRRVRITHQWIERSLSSPPQPPLAPKYPADGQQVRGTDITFQWPAASDASGDQVTDYHFQLADRADMKWPLSTNFDKLISRTTDHGTAQYRIPHVGLLNSDETYYWRVRAKNEHGVWGPWSATWDFTPIAPAHPLAIRLDFDPERSIGILRWQPNTTGRRPVRYRVYGSDEKGFGVHDAPYERFVGNQTHKIAARVPANYVSETEQTEMVVIGQGRTGPNLNCSFYRVVAIDNDGSRSAPSAYAAAPRPFIYSTPPTETKRGSKFRYQLSAIRSLGDLRCRSPAGDLAMAYWDVEQPQFALEQGPDWLQLDSAIGLLEGKPTAAGKFRVVVSATINRDFRVLDETQLSWGREKVLEVQQQQVGTTRQEFDLWVR